MRPSLKALRSRISKRAREAAQGGGVPAGGEPRPADRGARPGALERGAMRRRLRRARRLREATLTELGALVMEMQRQRRNNPALVERKGRRGGRGRRGWQLLGVRRAARHGRPLLRALRDRDGQQRRRRHADLDRRAATGPQDPDDRARAAVSGSGIPPRPAPPPSPETLAGLPPPVVTDRRVPCPRCGELAEPGQEICLRCGALVGRYYRRPPSWRIPAALAALGVLLVGAGVGFGVAELTHHKSAKKSAPVSLKTGPW